MSTHRDIKEETRTAQRIRLGSHVTPVFNAALMRATGTRLYIDMGTWKCWNATMPDNSETCLAQVVTMNENKSVMTMKYLVAH